MHFPANFDGFVHMRHNELIQITSDLVSSLCKDVSKEPTLQKGLESNIDLPGDDRSKKEHDVIALQFTKFLSHQCNR